MPGNKADKKNLRLRSTTPAELVAAGIGALIVALMIGCLTWYGIRQGDGVPDVTVIAGEAEPVSQGFRLEFLARNLGSGTAAQLHIEGELLSGDGVVERSITIVDYLPGYSERTGGLFFRNDPRQGQVSLRPMGYEKP